MKKTKVLVAGLIVMMFAAGAAMAQDDDASLLAFAESYGAVQGLSLYNGQIVLGITADAFYYEVYTAEQALTIVGEQQGFMDVQKDYIGKLLELPEVKEDPQFFKDMLYCVDRLKDTADALEKYIGDSSDENATKFDAAREKSYGAVADLLGIEE